MLTKELAIFDFDGPRVVPDRLTRARHGHYVAYAERMLQAYREGLGRTRAELHREIHRILDEEPDCPPQRVDAFCKLLDEEGVAAYETDRRGRAAALRMRVFRAAAPDHPLVETPDSLFERRGEDVKRRLAADIGPEGWPELEARLFADVFEFNRLRAFAGYPGGAALLARYNVAQTQAALYHAVRMTLRVTGDFARIVTHAKLARLLHDIVPDPGGGYRITLDGPASVLRETRRYAVNMARFLPVLLACAGWRMRADLRFRGARRFYLDLSPEDGLHSPLPPTEAFDSSVEDGFAKKWGPEPRDGWRLAREGAILQQGQTVMIPDFTLTHESGRKVHLEVVGFWTPEYLRAKIEKLRVFRDEPILLAVAERIAARWPELPPGVIRYKTAIKLQDVLAALPLPPG